MTETIRLGVGATEAVLSPIGCELLSCRVDGRELMWPGEARSWPRSAPVLFPFCGWLNGGAFRVGGRSYASAVHGFAPTTAFSVLEAGGGRAKLELRDNAGTWALFPFPFALGVEIAVLETGISYGFSVRNPGRDALPYALGFHPGFLCPLDDAPRAGHRIVFEQDEAPSAAQTAPGGLFTGRSVPLPLEGRSLDFEAAQRRADSIVMLDARSRRLALVSPSGRAIEVDTEGFPHWVFWSLPGAPYLCIEGWTGWGDPVGFSGDIADKPGMILLPPGGERQHSFRFSLRR